MIHSLIAVTSAVLLDRLIGDPPHLPHPVRLIGKIINFFDRAWNRGKYRVFKGALFLLLLAVFVFVTVYAITIVAYRVHVIMGIVVETVLIFTTIAQKGLKDAALDVYQSLNQGRLDEARGRLSMIVGRDTDDLSEHQVVRGTVETVAENVSDGVTAPLFWALIGGAPLAMVYRAVNTCDSMVGYKNERYRRFGKASARVDDVLNWLPSRLTGLLMVAVNRSPQGQTRKECLDTLLKDALKHPSPNSGWGEAATAALLGVQLGGENRYNGIVSNRALMGEPLVPLNKRHILESVNIMNRTSAVFVNFLWMVGIGIEAVILSLGS
jgi:adenosylcobinamide-phosphate synthase